MVEQWLDKTLDGDSAFMLAATRDDVTALNHHARSALQTEGVVGPDQLDIDGRRFAVGDWVMTLTNDYRLGVLNAAPSPTSTRAGARCPSGSMTTPPRRSRLRTSTPAASITRTR
jgi:hypothetical protein